MSQPVICAPGIDVTAVAKLKHADLWAASKSMGSQSALARHLGVQPSELGEWINLKRVPPSKPVGKRWTEDYICQMEAKLIALTGKAWDEIFPESLRNNVEFLECKKTIEKTAKMESLAMENYAIASRQRMLHGTVEGEQREVRIETIEAALGSCCNEREIKVLKMRFGLDGYSTHTCEEVALEFKVTHTRIRQIEAKAIRKIRDSRASEKLEECLIE